MRILHLAAGNRWTGAAAPAFAEVEALRAAGEDAHYAYVGGYKLEAKLRDVAFAHPLIVRKQNPSAAFRTLRALESLGRFDVIHAHLTYDHVLAAMIARRTHARLARTWHARRVLRRDPFSRLLVRMTDARFVVNSAFDIAQATFTPPPLDHRQFSPQGADVRERYGIAADAPVLVSIGKLTSDRGFDLALETFAVVARELPHARYLIIGHGPHQPALETHARTLGIDQSVIFAGYHEDDLAEHYRAADALLFAASGSDAGHRAVLEVMACGVVPVSAPLEGIDALLDGVGASLVALSPTPAALASRTIPILAARDASLREAVIEHSRKFGYPAAAERLLRAYRAAATER